MRAFPKKMLEEIYFKAIVPSVTYGFSVWGNYQPSSLTSLNSLHARASRIINNLQPSLADDVCLAKSNWLPISYFYKRSVVMLMHKVYILKPHANRFVIIFLKEKFLGHLEFKINLTLLDLIQILAGILYSIEAQLFGTF